MDPRLWGCDGVAFLWHPGYWGPHVGFYGGVNYGYGYGGQGYEGGYWQGGHMYYNRSVNNVSNTNITNVYNKTVINNVSVTRVSYNGGNGGVPAPSPPRPNRPRRTSAILRATPAQQPARTGGAQQSRAARQRQPGAPPIAATPRPGAFSGAGVVQATARRRSAHARRECQATRAAAR